jgi:hypothetical protein
MRTDIMEEGIIPALNSASFTSKGDIKAAATLLIAALILPLFNIVITITFAKILSPLFGGDVDIAGVMRLI